MPLASLSGSSINNDKPKFSQFILIAFIIFTRVSLFGTTVIRAITPFTLICFAWQSVSLVSRNQHKGARNRNRSPDACFRVSHRKHIAHISTTLACYLLFHWARKDRTCGPYHAFYLRIFVLYMPNTSFCLFLWSLFLKLSQSLLHIVFAPYVWGLYP